MNALMSALEAHLLTVLEHELEKALPAGIEIIEHHMNSFLNNISASIKNKKLTFSMLTP